MSDWLDPAQVKEQAEKAKIRRARKSWLRKIWERRIRRGLPLSKRGSMSKAREQPGAMDQEIRASLTEDVLALKGEVRRYRRWVADLQSGMFINCVYCGHRYGPAESVGVSMQDVLKKHVQQCSEHPMSALKRNNERLLDAIEEALNVYDREKDTENCAVLMTVPLERALEGKDED